MSEVSKRPLPIATSPALPPDIRHSPLQVPPAASEEQCSRLGDDGAADQQSVDSTPQPLPPQPPGADIARNGVEGARKAQADQLDKGNGTVEGYANEHDARVPMTGKIPKAAVAKVCE